MNDVKAFVIKRSEWLRGEGAEQSYLLRTDGKRCCVGIYGRALGMTDDQMAGCVWPPPLSQWPLWLNDMDAAAVRDDHAGPVIYGLSDANDNPRLTEHQREQLIQSYFATQDITVTFED